MKNAGAEPVKLYANSVLGEVSDGQVAVDDEDAKKPVREGPVQVDLSDSELGERDRLALRRLLDSYRDVFANGDDELGRTHIVQFSINTGDSSPVAVRARKTPYHLRPEVRKRNRSHGRAGDHSEVEIALVCADPDGEKIRWVLSLRC